MDFSICSRENERDYTWDHSHASSLLAKWSGDYAIAAFEGSLTSSRFAVLLRQPNDSDRIILAISVSTGRKDFRHRPIRTTAVLRAESQAETVLLLALFAECLNHRDEETLYDPDSPIAKAIEDIYQSKICNTFLKFCRELPKPIKHECCLKGNRAFPRDDITERRKLSEFLPSLLAERQPFLIALTDRTPEDVLKTTNDLGIKQNLLIFSKAIYDICPINNSLEEHCPEKHLRAAAIWISIGIFVIAAAVGGSCSSFCKGKVQTNTTEHQEGMGFSTTNNE